jgi:opacity protein-like surface antigen
MRILSLLGVLVLFSASAAMAQETRTKAEVFGGYQYVRFNPGGGNCHGGGGSVAGNVNNWFGLVGDFGVCKITGLPSGVSGHSFNYLGGPRVSFRSSSPVTPFAHALFGGMNVGGGVSGYGSGSSNAFAMALGGGVDARVSEHVSVRLMQFDYFPSRFGGTTQNNLRLQTGIVYRWTGSR